MLKGSAPNFNKSNYSSMMSRRRRESVTTLTLDTIMAEKHRPFSQLTTSHWEPSHSPFINRPISNLSRNSIDDYGNVYSAHSLLSEMNSFMNFNRENNNNSQQQFNNMRTRSPSIRNLSFFDNGNANNGLKYYSLENEEFINVNNNLMLLAKNEDGVINKET
ncbi:hypothetical protein K502DRAFT_152244 [Neoconidiobolus thromboides FSU 785]|nr:hypothetical protein K502DRAFT_152244 [Neoconidiobolus thromboides FSU 785]